MTSGKAGIGSVLRSLRGDLQDTADQKLTKVVAMLDGLASRGDADALIAALRPRLARLRLPRPLNFHRILFTPFDPLIVSAADFDPSTPAVPRTVLGPLGNLVRAADPALVRNFDALVAATPADAYSPGTPVGKTIWAAAGAILLSADRPRDWQHISGMRDAEFAPLCKSLGSILGLAAKLHDMVAADMIGVAPDTAAVEQLLTPLNTDDTRTIAMLLALLNATMPNAAAVRTMNQALALQACPPALRLAANQAQDFILGALETALPVSANLAQAPASVERAADTLDAQAARLRGHTAQLARLGAARSRIDNACRAQFDDFMTRHVFAPLAHIANADDATIDIFEHDARALRRFEQAARRIGGAANYDQALRASAEKLRPHRDDSIATKTDKLRLAEILLGSQAAAELG